MTTQPHELAGLHVTLRALDGEMVGAWSDAFDDVSRVAASQGSILDHRADAIVSAANSFGFMDGGLDLVYSQHFGWALESRVRSRILEDHDGELPVGQAIIVETDRQDFRWLVLAPTMRVPMNVATTAHAYLAFRATLQTVRAHNRAHAPEARIGTLACPALCTGEGRMPFERCARQMRRAWDVIVDDALIRKGGLAAAVEDHIDLVD